MKNSTWKTLAILFILLFVIETLCVLYLINVGVDMVEGENECAAICTDDGGFYAYDDYTYTCQCLNGDSEVVSTHYTRGG